MPLFKKIIPSTIKRGTIEHQVNDETAIRIGFATFHKKFPRIPLDETFKLKFMTTLDWIDE